MDCQASSNEASRLPNGREEEKENLELTISTGKQLAEEKVKVIDLHDLSENNIKSVKCVKFEKNENLSKSLIETTSNPSSAISIYKKPTIKDFELINDLGSGAFAKVSLARYLLNNKKVAIKIMDKYFMNKLNKSHEAFIEREILSNCDHPNIIKLISTFHDKEKLYYVLEYAPNKDLASFLRSQGVLSFDSGRFYAAQIMNAIEYLQTKNIAHRDLKPENIVLDSNMHIKLVDFSTAIIHGMSFSKKEMRFKPNVSKVENGGTEEGENGMTTNNSSSISSIADILRSQTLVGTAEYASPEMLNNTVVSYMTTDIWALGCIIFKIFHGKTPFKGHSEMIIFDNIINMRFTISRDLPEIVQDLLKRMLVESPERRLGSGANGTEYDFASLKSHDFFKGINFNKLYYQSPPIKINTFYPKLDKTKSTGDLNSILTLHSLNTDIIDLNLSTGNVMEDIQSPTPLLLKKCFSSNILKTDVSVSEFTYEAYSDWQYHDIIEDYVYKVHNSNNVKGSNDIILLQEGVLKKHAFLLVYTTRKLKLYSNKKLEIWDLEQNTIIVNKFNLFFR